jgi:hypothetical protein
LTSGGLELLFGKVKKHAVSLTVGDKEDLTVKALLKHMETNMIKEVCHGVGASV